MHLPLYVKSDFHVFYCDFAKSPLVCNDATCHPSEKQGNPIFGNLVYETETVLVS